MTQTLSLLLCEVGAADPTSQEMLQGERVNRCAVEPTCMRSPGMGREGGLCREQGGGPSAGEGGVLGSNPRGLRLEREAPPARAGFPFLQGSGPGRMKGGGLACLRLGLIPGPEGARPLLGSRPAPAVDWWRTQAQEGLAQGAEVPAGAGPHASSPAARPGPCSWASADGDGVGPGRAHESSGRLGGASGPRPTGSGHHFSGCGSPGRW